MGFHANRASPQQDKAPSKNRVGVFHRSSLNRVRSPAPQPVAKEQFSAQPPSIFTSGLPCWLSRDPIGEEVFRQFHEAEINTLNERQAVDYSPFFYSYGFVSNSTLSKTDYLGLLCFWMCDNTGHRRRPGSWGISPWWRKWECLYSCKLQAMRCPCHKGCSQPPEALGPPMPTPIPGLLVCMPVTFPIFLCD